MASICVIFAAFYNFRFAKIIVINILLKQSLISSSHQSIILLIIVILLVMDMLPLISLLMLLFPPWLSLAILSIFHFQYYSYSLIEHLCIYVSQMQRGIPVDFIFASKEINTTMLEERFLSFFAHTWKQKFFCLPILFWCNFTLISYFTKFQWAFRSLFPTDYNAPTFVFKIK